MRILLLAAALAAAGGLAARVQAEPAVPSAVGLDRLSAFFENEVTSGRIPGAVVLIQQHGSPVYLKSFGVQDVATKAPMTPDTIFALHYAHEYYGARGDHAIGGLTFPGRQPPDYWDFLYFSLVIAMTSQVSDVVITSKVIRRIVTVHGALAFFFNVAVFALTVNIVSNLI